MDDRLTTAWECWCLLLTIIMTLFLFCLGIAIIAKGGAWFADGALGFASRTGIPKIIIGATIMSFATTIPEFTVSFLASLSGNSSTALGNAIGSTVANIGLILAIAVLIHPLRQQRINMSPLVGATLSLVLVTFFARDGMVTRGDAAILFGLLIVFMWWQVARLRRDRATVPDMANNNSDDAVMTVGRASLLFAAGAVAVVVGSRLVVQYGVVLADLMGVPQRVIALTLVSIGTSLPELVASVAAARRGHTDLAAGNILGANLFNIAWVLPGAALVNPLTVELQTVTVDIPVSFVMLAGVAVGMWRGGLNRLWGIIALTVYVAYVIHIFL